MIRKGFVDLPHGQVHFRYAGKGPPVLLLHDSPRSSAMHEALIQELADEFTAIALDTPGYGHSDPLPAAPQPEIPDFARALAGAQAALGIERCAIYGFHTSSKILLQFALDHPQRVALGIIDGLNLPPGGPGDAFITRYMQPLPILADGSHLAAGWARAREFMRFFPWFDSTPRSRLLQDFPSDEYLHGYALDLLTAGPHYSDAYSAAMRYLATPLVEALRAPMVFMCRSNDPLYPFLDALPQPLPAGSRIERLGPERDRWAARLGELFRGAVAQTSAPALELASAARGDRSDAATPNMMRRRYCEGRHGQWHQREAGVSSQPAVIVLPESPGSSVGRIPLLTALAAAGRHGIAPDLPGIGDSAPLPGDAGKPPRFGDFVAAFDEWLARLAVGPVDIIAGHSTATLALAFAARSPQRVRTLVCDGVPLVGARERKALGKFDCPEVALCRDGTHLIAIWHQLRDRQLHWPWYERSVTAIRRIEADLDAHRLHGQTLDLARQLRHYGDYARALWAESAPIDWNDVSTPVVLFKDSNDPRLAATLRVRRRLKGSSAVRRPSAAGTWTSLV